MASNLKVSLTTASAQAAALVGTFTNSSVLKLYDGTQPATPETAVSTQHLLATVVLPAASAFTQTNGVMTAGEIAGVSVALSGTASWFRWLKADGTTPIADGSVGVSGADFNLSSVALVIGENLAVSGFTFTVPGV